MLDEKNNPLKFDNIFKADGRFRYYAEIETVTIPEGGLNIGSLLKKNGAKYEFTEGNPVCVLAEDVKNETNAALDVNCIVCKSGAVLGDYVKYAGADDFEKVKDSLADNHIDIVKGGI